MKEAVMTRYIAGHLNSMRRIFMVMIAFGLATGLVFPLVAEPFVNWQPGRKLYFQVACLAAGFAVGSFCYYLVKVTLFEKNKQLAERKERLESAKDRFSKLTGEAIMSRDWDVSFHDGHVPTCWEVKGCKKVDCPCHGSKNMRCWLVTGTFCGGKVQGHFAQKLDSCAQCSVYQEAVEMDPINEIGENFNSLMWVVKEREDELSKARDKLQQNYAELERLHEQVKEASITDALTGLRNHGHFQERLAEEVERTVRYDRQLSLIMLDLDYFKLINDRHGHQMGDRVLEGLGRFLREELRNVDCVARYGGEEFVIIMPETAGPDAVAVAERLRLKVGDVAEFAGLNQEPVAASFGVADLPACAGDKESLIAAADSALLFAKSKGRNRVAYFRELSETDLGERDLDSLNMRLEGASLKTICSLAEAVDARDRYTGAESQRFAVIARHIAARLELSDEQAESLSLATTLHDIGKIGVPDSVLNKKDKLSPDEVNLVQQHPKIGKRIVREAQQINELVTAILYHHERWDGSGYPEKLTGEEIPLLARIVGIFDAYRAMTTDRPYRKALDERTALRELRDGAGSQFDPELVRLFIEVLEDSGEQTKAEAG